jgi:Tfp pilus assembly protein PilF
MDLASPSQKEEVMRLFAILAFILAPSAASADTVDSGLHALVRNDYATAARELADAVAEDPHDPIAHFNYASALRELGQNEDAITEYRAAFREGDEQMKSNALYGIGLVRAQEGEPGRTAQAWREYLSFAGNRPADSGAVEVARQNLASAERDLGARKAAR